MADPLRPRIKRSFPGPREQRRNLVNPPIDTFLIGLSSLDKTKIELHFARTFFRGSSATVTS
jgi:hypothetical protein